MVIKIVQIGSGYLIEWISGEVEYLTDFEMEERKLAAKEVA